MNKKPERKIRQLADKRWYWVVKFGNRAAASITKTRAEARAESNKAIKWVLQQQ